MTEEPKPNVPGTTAFSQSSDSGSSTAVKNSLANIATGLSTAVLTVAVPPVLARTLSHMEFNAWALVLQVAGYIAVLDLGIQGAIGRYVAYYLADGRQDLARDFAGTAATLLIVVAVSGFAVLACASLDPRALFPQIPPQLVEATTMATCVVGAAMAGGVVSSLPRGLLVGVERNEIITKIIGPSRIVLACLLILVASMGYGIVPLAAIYLAVNAFSYTLLWSAARRISRIPVDLFRLVPSAVVEIRNYCGSTLIWSVAMLMVSGLDIAIVGRLDFARVAAYSACVGPIIILGGVQQAMFGPLLQVGARHSAIGGKGNLTELLERATRISVVVNLVYAIPLILFSSQILNLWLGPSYATEATTILRLLLVGHALRLIAIPYITLLLASGGHHRIRFVPLLEGVTNVATAILLGRVYGAAGVAGGVVAGAAVAQVANYYFNFPRTPHVVMERSRLLRRSVLQPILCFSPVALLVPLQFAPSYARIALAMRIGALLVSGSMLWKYALSADDRRLFQSFGLNGFRRWRVLLGWK